MPLTVATWNVENFALPEGGTSVAFGRKLTRIAATLAALDADVIALQEILDDQVAGRIASALNQLAGTNAYTAVNGLPDRRHNRVAFVARLPVIATETEHLHEWQLPDGAPVMRLERTGGAIVTVPEPTLPRPPIRVRVSLADGTSVDVINVHLKSKLVEYPGGGFSTDDESLRTTATGLTLKRRMAEAITVRARVDRLLAQGHRVVVLGDFNAAPDAATTQRLCGSHGHSDAQRLLNLTDRIPAAARWSRRNNGQRDMLDQILVSDGLFHHHTDPVEPPTVAVLNDDLPSDVSDHAPVYATFHAMN